MDLNYLYFRRGKSLLMAAQARCDRSRAVHLDLARGYRARIRAARSAAASVAA